MTTMPERTPQAPPPARRPRRTARFVVAGLLTVAALLVTVPDRLVGLDRFPPFAQVVAFRPYVTVAVGLAALVALVATVFHRRRWPFAAGLLAVAVAGAVLVVPRLVPGEEAGPGAGLSVLVANVKEGRADPAGIAALVRDERPDLVSLPEAGLRYRDRLAALVAPLGYTARSSTGPDVIDKNGLTVLVADRLGAVDLTTGSTMQVPWLQVSGGALGGLRFVAVHPRSPLPGRTALWRNEVARLADWCAGPTPAIVAGDLNATLDHSVLRDATTGCDDAAARRGTSLTPTWSPWPRLGAGAQLDHVLATAGIRATDVAILPIPGSDHRAVLARLVVGGASQSSSTGSASTP